MSQQTEAALARLDELIPALQDLPEDADSSRLRDEMQAMRRAVSAFHMEAIRFRMYNVDRLMRLGGDRYPAPVRERFDALRRALEEAGFHTRSHVAP